VDDNLTPTERRKTALGWVREQRVTYSPSRAAYLLDGEEVTGWDWRTFSEMRQAKWIETRAQKANPALSDVVLTEAGDKIESSG
jgi:hypothetical protein